MPYSIIFTNQIYKVTFLSVQPTLLHLVTPLMQFLLHNPDVTKKDLETVKGSVAGGAPTGKTLISRYLEKFDHGMIYQEGNVCNCNNSLFIKM